MNLPSALQYAGLGGAVTSLTSGTILAPTDGELGLCWALVAMSGSLAMTWYGQEYTGLLVLPDASVTV